MDVIIYHNPECGTSRNTLGLIRNAGVEPHVIEYLKTPPTRLMLRKLIERMRVSVRSIVARRQRPIPISVSAILPSVTTSCSTQ